MKGFQPNSNFSGLPSSGALNKSTSCVSGSPLQLPVKTLLVKRGFEDHENTFHKALEKKIKGFGDNLSQAYGNTLNNTTSMPVLNRCTPNPLLSSTGLQDQLMKAFFYHQLHPLLKLKFDALSSLNSQSTAFLNLGLKPTLQDQNVNFFIPSASQKEEEQSQGACSDETAESQDEQIRITSNNINHHILVEEEPALAELTKQYPEWDLSTIFDFLKSGKTKKVYENGKVKKANTLRKKKGSKQESN